MNRCTDILRKVKALPALPGTALKLMQVINDPLSTVDDLVGTIKYDQAVTGEVLKICNSAYFGLARRVSSLNDAMVYLGTVRVLQLVMAIHTNALLAREQRGYGLAPGVLWKHSVGVALASSAVAQRLKLPNASLVFTAGLLHDIGKVVLNEYVAEEVNEILRRVTQERLSFLEAEQQVLGFSHQEIGGKIADTWALPEGIVRCIRYHHAPQELDPPDLLVDTVYLANCVCRMLGIGLGEDGLYYRADSSVMQRTGLGKQDIELIGVQMLSELKRVEQLFSDDSAKNRSKQTVAG